MNLGKDSLIGSVAILFGLGVSAIHGELLIKSGVDGQISLQWFATEDVPPASGAPNKWIYQAQWSPDGISWEPLGEPIAHSVEEDPPVLQKSFLPQTPTGLLRVVRRLEFGVVEETSEPVDYDVQFTHFLEQIEPGATVQEGYAGGTIDAIDWDPTTAAFWEEFQTDPADHNANRPPDDPERRLHDFRMNAEEEALFRKNGFVVSERLAADVPSDLYYHIWTDDLPVFISADSVLNGWHRSFSVFLEEIEELYALPKLYGILFDPKLDTGIPDLWNELGEDRDKLREPLGDVIVFLYTARSAIRALSSGSPIEGAIPGTNERIRSWNAEIWAAEEPLIGGLFGDPDHAIDATLFTPRGHYTNSEILIAYFKTLLWLGAADFRVAGPGVSKEQAARELRAAALLSLIVREFDLLDRWREMEAFLAQLGGEKDSMSVAQMLALLNEEGLNTYRSLASDENIEALQERILASNYGLQRISTSSVILRTCEPEEEFLPRVFTFFGQRWTPDSWALSKFVFPNVEDEDGESAFRRLPSGVDVAYAVLGNDAAGPILHRRMQDREGVPFRDGIPFHRNLLAVRAAVDAQGTDFWESSVYLGWLSAVRGLGEAPQAHPSADVFRTTAWRDRTLQTQLAAWTELRHDMLLYAKQSGTPTVLCDYPDGYVDPYPECFDRLATLANETREFVNSLSMSGTMYLKRRDPDLPPPPDGPQPFGLDSRFFPWTWNPLNGYPHNEPEPVTIGLDAAERKASMIEHFEHFASSCRTLRDIARHQTTGQPLSAGHTDFIKNTTEDFSTYAGIRTYSGWFPKLYYNSELLNDQPAGLFKPVVADVHTDGKDLICTGDPGAILYQATGRTNLIFVAVRHPDGSGCMYAGPVSSHYEFTTPLGGPRLNDQLWLSKLDNGDLPNVAEWTSSFLVSSAKRE